MTPFHLNNKTILVTGASSGIGRQAAIGISAMGANVVITGRDKNRLNDTFLNLKGNNNIQLTSDFTIEEELISLVKKIPQLDGVFNCAGIVKPFPIKFITAQVLSEVFDVNFNAQVL
ncbi:MAG: SDR family oxidoreductase, partial [Flavobacteriales bacterium]|nr:SDR family oxidoreductase [Flavobacteriales bacterium]